jgi:hypothetical protein
MLPKPKKKLNFCPTAGIVPAGDVQLPGLSHRRPHSDGHRTLGVAVGIRGIWMERGRKNSAVQVES